LRTAGRFGNFHCAMSDDGFTFLPGGLRLKKSDPLFDSLGALDELNAALGLLRVALAGEPDAMLIESLQGQILQVGSELANGKAALGMDAVIALEKEIASRLAGWPPLHGFVRPGTDEVTARAHWARAVCRRAERELVRARESHPDRIFSTALAYLDRLSSLLFAMTRAKEQ